jgi:pseudouridine synthase
MLEGRVAVNGAVVRELGTRADPARDDIRVDGRRIRLPERHRYVLLNKPRGYVTTRSDPQQRPTVIDLIGIRDYLYPVGRLDFDSEGLLLLTNDGDLAARLTHPRHGVPRVYEARVLGVPDAHDLERLARGLVIDGRRTAPAEVRLVGAAPARARARAARPVASRRGASRPADDRATLVITVREGRNRQVRRMCDAIGHPVTSLTRVAIGPLRDTGLKVGRWRELTDEEVHRLRAATGARSDHDVRGARRPRARERQ